MGTCLVFKVALADDSGVGLGSGDGVGLRLGVGVAVGSGVVSGVGVWVGSGVVVGVGSGEGLGVGSADWEASCWADSDAPWAIAGAIELKTSRNESSIETSERAKVLILTSFVNYTLVEAFFQNDYILFFA
ncbi:MAG: hypothetical protein AAB482_03235 [Patescibacteria group bacterium]